MKNNLQTAKPKLLWVLASKFCYLSTILWAHFLAQIISIAKIFHRDWTEQTRIVETRLTQVCAGGTFLSGSIRWRIIRDSTVRIDVVTVRPALTLPLLPLARKTISMHVMTNAYTHKHARSRLRTKMECSELTRLFHIMTVLESQLFAVSRKRF